MSEDNQIDNPIEDAEFKDIKSVPSEWTDANPIKEVLPMSPLPEETVIFPQINGQVLNEIKYQDFQDIRVVYDAKTGAVLGVMPVKKTKKVK